MHCCAFLDQPLFWWNSQMFMFSTRILYHLKALQGCGCGRGLKVYPTFLSYEGNHAETESFIVLKKSFQKSEYSPFPLDKSNDLHQNDEVLGFGSELKAGAHAAAAQLFPCELICLLHLLSLYVKWRTSSFLILMLCALFSAVQLYWTFKTLLWAWIVQISQSTLYAAMVDASTASKIYFMLFTGIPYLKDMLPSVLFPGFSFLPLFIQKNQEYSSDLCHSILYLQSTVGAFLLSNSLSQVPLYHKEKLKCFYKSGFMLTGLTS